MRSLQNITNNILHLNGLPTMQEQEQAKQKEEPRYVHPIMTREDFKNSMANYKKFIATYNMEVRAVNADVDKYNKQVIANRKANKPGKRQRIEEQLWKEDHKHLSPDDYNTMVEAYNEQNGYQIRKKRLKQEVKPATEKYFMAFLHQFNMQLFKRKQMRKKLNVDIEGDLPMFDLYPNKIVEYEQDGAVNLPVHRDTVTHHRDVLLECGVMDQYKYRGAKRAVKVRFNPSLICLTDNDKNKPGKAKKASTPSKQATTENQSVNNNILEKVQYNNVSSSKNILVNNKYRGKMNEPIGSNAHIATKNNYKKNQGQGSRGGNDRQANLSDVLATTLEDRPEITKKLARREFENHKPIDIQILKKEAYTGNLHPEDFAELCSQEILKNASIIFADLEKIHPGSWMNALKFIKERFAAPGKSSNFLSKPKVLDRYNNMQKAMNEIKKFKRKHTSWQPCYPSRYFDMTRRYKENNSFEYAIRYFKLHHDRLEEKGQRSKRAMEEQQQSSLMRQVRMKIRQFLYGKISLQTLYDHVNYNTNEKIMSNLEQLIRHEKEAITK